MRLLLIAVLSALTLAALAYLAASSQSWPLWREHEAAPTHWSIAILGDSDSHAFHDRLNLDPTLGARGGAFHGVTWQWSEWLAKIRPDTVDMGEWGRWGTGWQTAWVHDKLKLSGRSPAKLDNRYNFALSGAGCGVLEQGHKTATRLVALMNREPLRWTRGTVVIRIGVNDFGQPEFLEALAHKAQDPAVQASIAACLRDIDSAVALIHAHHPQVSIVLVGIFNNAHWAKVTDRWQDPAALSRIQQGLNVFDQGLQAMVAHDPSRLAYFDDQAWFRQHWGERNAQGLPAYRTLVVGGHFAVSNSSSDHPSHSVLADGHAGTIWNLLWAQSLIDLINRHFAAGIPPVDEPELSAVLARELNSSWPHP
jgi:hypothetical protein